MRASSATVNATYDSRTLVYDGAPSWNHGSGHQSMPARVRWAVSCLSHQQ